MAVLSDIHANAGALAAATADIAARRPDAVVVLGDLLTYGCEPHAVLDGLEELGRRLPLHVVKGNHDELYFRPPLSPAAPDVGRFAAFVRESVEWTLQRVDGAEFEQRFPWQERLTVEGLLFAHANPFSYGDWSYLDDEAQLRRAAATLGSAGCAAGVFGHTHRRRAAQVVGDRVADLTTSHAPSPGAGEETAGQGRLVRTGDTASGQAGVTILNPGSVGQPRGSGSSMLYLAGGPSGLRVTFTDLRYDVAAHTRAVAASDLSEQTKARLLGYFPTPSRQSSREDGQG